jgi:hypothetical protein
MNQVIKLTKGFSKILWKLEIQAVTPTILIRHAELLSCRKQLRVWCRGFWELTCWESKTQLLNVDSLDFQFPQYYTEAFRQFNDLVQTRRHQH